MLKNIEELKQRIATEENYVYAPKFGCLLTNVVAKYPNGLTDKQISKMLLMEESEVTESYLESIETLKEIMGVGDDEA